jgi:hypothetical protein
VDKDKADFEMWLKSRKLEPSRSTKGVWLVVWRAARRTMRAAPVPEKRSWFAKLMDILG